MKRILPVLAALALFWTTLSSAQDSKEEKSLGFAFDAVSGTKYVSEFGLTYLNDWYAGQTASLWHEKSGLYVDVKNMYAPSRKFNSGEPAGWFEAYVGQEGELGGVKYDAYVGYYVYEIDRIGSASDGAYGGLKMKFPKVYRLTPFVGGEYYYLYGETGQNGFVWRAGVEYELRELKVKLFATGHDRVFNADPAALASGIASAGYKIRVHKNVAIVPSLSYQQRVERKERDGGLTNGGFWGVLSVRFTLE